MKLIALKEKQPGSFFTPELRNLFCTFLIQYITERNETLSKKTFIQIRNQIVEEFPEEDGVSFYS